MKYNNRLSEVFVKSDRYINSIANIIINRFGIGIPDDNEYVKDQQEYIRDGLDTILHKYDEEMRELEAMCYHVDFPELCFFLHDFISFGTKISRKKSLSPKDVKTFSYKWSAIVNSYYTLKLDLLYPYQSMPDFDFDAKQSVRKLEFFNQLLKATDVKYCAKKLRFVKDGKIVDGGGYGRF